MIRLVFSLVVAVAAFVSPSHGALLTYDFTNSAAGVVNPVTAGTAANFAGSGSFGATSWTTAALSSGSKLNNFSFTAASGVGVSIGDLVVAARRATGPNGAQIEVFYNVGATSTGVGGTALGINTISTSSTPFTYNIGLDLQAGETLHFTIRSSKTNTYTGAAIFDYVTVDGSVVPEPTSMAVFGLLGAGIAARRIRRKA